MWLAGMSCPAATCRPARSQYSASRRRGRCPFPARDSRCAVSSAPTSGASPPRPAAGCLCDGCRRNRRRPYSTTYSSLRVKAAGCDRRSDRGASAFATHHIPNLGTNSRCRCSCPCEDALRLQCAWRRRNIDEAGSAITEGIGNLSRTVRRKRVSFPRPRLPCRTAKRLRLARGILMTVSGSHVPRLRVEHALLS